MGKRIFHWGTLHWHYPPTILDIDALLAGEEVKLEDYPVGIRGELSIMQSFCKHQIHRIRTQQYAFARSVGWDANKYPPEYKKADEQVKELNKVRSRVEYLQSQL